MNELTETVKENGQGIVNPVTADDLDELLSSYKSSYTTEEPIKESSEETTETPSLEKTVNESWEGNPAYYQTGKKKGQLKPSAKSKIPKEEMEISGSLIDGAMFIMLIDILFPLLIVILNNRFLDGEEISVDDIQLTEKQKKDLSPIADEVVKQISLKANPAWLLAISMAGIYGINFMSVKMK